MLKKIFMCGAALMITIGTAYAADDVCEGKTLDANKQLITQSNAGYVFDKDVTLDNPIAVKAFIEKIQSVYGPAPDEFHIKDTVKIVVSRPSDTKKFRSIITFLDKNNCSLVFVGIDNPTLQNVIREAANGEAGT